MQHTSCGRRHVALSIFIFLRYWAKAKKSYILHSYSTVVCTERTRLIEGSDVERTISHSEAAEMNFKCSATSDDSTSVNSTWYRLERDLNTGEIYEVIVYNRSDKLTISGPDNTLTIKLAANDSEGWAVYGGRYLCRVTNGYSSDQRHILIDVRDIPLPDKGTVPSSRTVTLILLRLS